MQKNVWPAIGSYTQVYTHIYMYAQMSEHGGINTYICCIIFTANLKRPPCAADVSDFIKYNIILTRSCLVYHPDLPIIYNIYNIFYCIIFFTLSFSFGLWNMCVIQIGVDTFTRPRNDFSRFVLTPYGLKIYNIFIIDNYFCWWDNANKP